MTELDGNIDGTVRYLRFLDGFAEIVPRDACRGCYIEANQLRLSSLLQPLCKHAGIVVRQDAEWPVPGFFIVSPTEHVGSIADMTLTQFTALCHVLRMTRRGMKEALGISRVHMYHEEKFHAPHVHVWLLPLWPEMIARSSLNPRVYEGTIREYLNCFDFQQERPRIEAANRAIQRWLTERLTSDAS